MRGSDKGREQDAVSLPDLRWYVAAIKGQAEFKTRLLRITLPGYYSR